MLEFPVVTASLVRMRPGMKVTFIGDSITASQACGGWQAEFINRYRMLYGDTGTFANHGIGGEDIPRVHGDQVPLAISDGADVVIIECGVNNILSEPSLTRASIKAEAVSLLTDLFAGLPSVQVGWLNIWSGWGGLTIPNPNQALIDAINGGISDACAQMKVQYIDVYTTQITDQNSTTPPANNVTYDGVHPHWRGRPLMARQAINQIDWNLASGTDVDVTPGYNFDTDVAPSVWIEADQPGLSGLISSLGYGSHPFTASGVARPSLIPNGWQYGVTFPKPCIRFDGVANWMTSNLSTASGGKTMLFVYKLASFAVGFNNFYSLLTLTNGVVSSEFMATTAGGVLPVAVSQFDVKRSGSDGFFTVGTNDVYHENVPADTLPHNIRYGAIFAGGSSTDTGQYTLMWGGTRMGVVAAGTFVPQDLTALCALGARASDGVTPTNFFAGDLVLGLVWPAQLTTQQFYRACAKARVKWGP
jgi:lysophospholipase L1-like esterase